MGEADLEEVGAGVGELLQVATLFARGMEAGGDEGAQRAALLGELGVQRRGGGQRMPFPAGAVVRSAVVFGRQSRRRE
ncbi:hypothetical protein [Streptomyces tendae]|uniref:hypothetical protein n=1 Tax=Streptomyces tendae TaxID=1932 RepID=UPI0037199CEF